MANIIKPIDVDVARENIYVYILAKQGDNDSRFLKITLLNEGEPVDISGATAATLTAVKPDKTVTITNGTISSGTVTVELTQQTLAIDGPVICFLSVVQGDSILSTMNFTVNVEATNVDEDKIISSDEFTAFQEALMAIGDIDDLKEELQNALKEVEGLFPVQTANIADGAVTGSEIADWSVSPNHTDFVERTSQEIEGEGFYWIVGTNPVPDNPGFYTYTVQGNDKRVYFADASDSGTHAYVQGGYIDTNGPYIRLWVDAVGEWYTLHKIVFTSFPATVTFFDNNNHGHFGAFPGTANFYYVDDSVEIPSLKLDREQIAQAAGRFVVRRDVDELPSGKATPYGDPLVLGQISQGFFYHDSGSSDLMTTFWLDLNAPVDLSPVTEYKRFRATVVLERDDEQPIDSTFHGGEIRIRNRNNDSQLVRYYLNEYAWKCGVNHLDLPLTGFTPQSSTTWGSMDQVTIFTYKTKTVAASMTVKDIEFVDGDVAIAENAIYIVPSDDPQAGDAHDKYMYIDGAWEKLGGSGLSGLVETEDIADGAVTAEKTDFAKRTSQQVTGSGFTWIKTGTSAPDKPGWMTYTIESGDKNQYFADAENDGFYVSVDGGYINTSGKWVVIPEDIGSSHFERPLHEIVVTRYPAVVTFVSAESGYWGYFAPGTALEYLEQELTIPNLSVGGEQIEDGTVTPEKTSFAKPKSYKTDGTQALLQITSGDSMESNHADVVPGQKYFIYDYSYLSSVTFFNQREGTQREVAVGQLSHITVYDLSQDVVTERAGVLVEPQDGENILWATFSMTGYSVPLWKLSIYALSIPQFELEEGSVDTDNLADSSVTTAKLADEAVSTGKIADGAVTGTKIANNTVTRDNLAPYVKDRLGHVYAVLPEDEMYFEPYPGEQGYTWHWTIDPNKKYFTDDSSIQNIAISVGAQNYYLQLSMTDDGMYAVGFSPEPEFSSPTSASSSVSEPFNIYQLTNKVDLNIQDGTVTLDKLGQDVKDALDEIKATLASLTGSGT